MEAVKLWEQVETQGDCYSPRTGHAAVLYRSQIFIFSGIDDDTRKADVHMLDLSSNLWTELRPKGVCPTPRSGLQAALLGDDIYLFGGYTKKDGEFFADLFRYSPGENSFECLSPAPNELPEARTDHSLVSYSTSLYAFAGFSGRERLNDLWEYSPQANKWTLVECESHPEPRFGHTAVVHRDRMLIFGGWDGHQTLGDLWSFSFTHRKWTRLVTSGHIAPRYRHSATLCGSSLFVFGGVNKDQVRFADVYELNTSLRHWIRVETAGTVPSPRTFHRTILYEGFMYVFGGFDGVRRNDMYRLYLQDLSPEEDLESNPMVQMRSVESEAFVWQVVVTQGAIYSKRTGHSGVSLNGFFYIFGGTDETNRRNDLYRFDPSIKAWAQLPALGDTPTPRSGSRGQGYEGSLYFFGGYTKKDGEYFGELHKFDVGTLEWSKLRSGPAPRADHTLVLYEDCLYVFGGYDGKTRFNDLHEYCIPASRWQRLDPSGLRPTPRFGHSAAVCSRSFYVFGGWDGHDTLDDLYEYSFPGETWTEIEDTAGIRPSPRYRHSCTAYLSALYLFGGVDKGQNRYNDMYRYWIGRKEWELLRPKGQVPSARTFHRALLHEDTLYILGGFDGKRQNDMHSIKLDAKQLIKRQDSTFSRISDLEDREENKGQDLLAYFRRQVQILTNNMKEIELRLQKEIEKDMCHLCYERPIDTVILDCGHRVMCFRCSGNLRACPVCRQDISRLIRTFQ